MALKASARNCTVAPSRMGKFLKTEASRLLVDGCRKSGDVREVFPKVKFGACEKTDVLKYAFHRRLVKLPARTVVVGTLAGRAEVGVVAAVAICSGMPVWNVAIPFSCQPPRTKSNARGKRRRVCLAATERELVVTADHEALRDVLGRDGPLGGAVVEVLLRAGRAEEGYRLRCVIDQLAGGEADEQVQAVGEALLDAQREGVVERVRLRLAEGVHACVLREWPQQLGVRDRRLRQTWTSGS